MNIQKIEIVNFRGIDYFSFEPEHLNAFYGKNGSGKSSILDALAFAFAGKVSAKDIRNGALSAEVIITFDGDDVLHRIREEDVQKVYINDKNTTLKAAESFIANRIGCDTKTFLAVSGYNFFEGISKKDITDLFTKALPIVMDYDKMTELADIKGENKSFIKQWFPDSVFGLDEINRAYKLAYDLRKVTKAELKNLQTLCTDVPEISEDISKEALEKRLDEILEKEVFSRTVEKQQADRKILLEKKEKLKEELYSFKDLSEPNEELIRKEKEEKEQFVSAIAKAENTIVLAQSNINLASKTLEALKTDVCPISKAIKCQTNRSGLKTEMEKIVAENSKAINDKKNFIERCNKEIAGRDAFLKKAEADRLAWERKELIRKQYEEIVIPDEVLIKEHNFTEEKEKINNDLLALSKQEAYSKNLKLLQEKEEELSKLEYAVATLDTKGVPALILKKTLDAFQTKCNENASKISDDIAVYFNFNEGVDISVKTAKSINPVPLESISSGEMIVVYYLLAKTVNQAVGVKYLICDDIDRLDHSRAEKFMKLCKSDSDFEHIFISFVDHEDLKAAAAVAGANGINLK